MPGALEAPMHRSIPRSLDALPRARNGSASSQGFCASLARTVEPKMEKARVRPGRTNPGLRLPPQARAKRGLSLDSQNSRAGIRTTAPIMFMMNMKVSISPMSAWNFSSENTQVPTPAASVSAV